MSLEYIEADALPCPFCNSKAQIFVKTVDSSIKRYRMSCTNFKCLASNFAFRREYEKSPEEALTFWNKRVYLPPDEQSYYESITAEPKDFQVRELNFLLRYVCTAYLKQLRANTSINISINPNVVICPSCEVTTDVDEGYDPDNELELFSLLEKIKHKSWCDYLAVKEVYRSFNVQ